MQFSPATLASVVVSYSSFILAMPSPPQSANPALNKRTLTPASVDCGGGKGFLGLTGPDVNDLPKAADRLAQKGGTCTTPTGYGQCIRVACDNTTAIWMCNSETSAGPNSAACTDIASYAYREATVDDADDLTTTYSPMDVYGQCYVPGYYSVSVLAGMAVDEGGAWTVVAAYGNCNHPATDQPNQQ